MKSKHLIPYNEGGGANQTTLLWGKCFSLVEKPPDVNFGDITSLVHTITKTHTHNMKRSFTKNKKYWKVGFNIK